MRPYQQRVINEKSELDERLEKLQAFTLTQVFKDLKQSDREDLIEQSIVMKMLSDILARRIAAFEITHPEKIVKLLQECGIDPGEVRHMSREGYDICNNPQLFMVRAIMHDGSRSSLICPLGLMTFDELNELVPEK